MSKRDTNQKLDVTEEDVGRWILRINSLNHSLDTVESRLNNLVTYYKTKMWSEDRRSVVFKKNEAAMEATKEALRLLQAARVFE